MPNITSLPEGKLPIGVLYTLLDSIEHEKMVVPPQVGVDVGVTKCKGRFLVSSSDPITGTEKSMGWHAVHVSANDVATSGIMPDSLNAVMMFPPRTGKPEIMSLMAEITRTAGKLGITVAGGHTEITPALQKPIIVVTCFGTGDNFVTAANAKVGDSILMTKTAGIEGTSILAALRKITKLVSSDALIRGKRLIKKLSILPEAKLAFSTGLVNAMHDVTEGGVMGAVFEMSLAADLGFELETSQVPVDPSTMDIAKSLHLNPLRLIGSGSLLISCDESSEKKIKDSLLAKGIQCTKIGRFVSESSGRKIIRSRKKIKVKESMIQDELWKALRKFQ